MKYKKILALISITLIFFTNNWIGFAISEPELTLEQVVSETSEESEQTQKNEDLKQSLSLSLLAEFVGAFLGVLAALALNKYSESKSIASLEKELFDELSNICDELEKRLNQKEDFIFYQYSTPIWDINLAAGNLSLFINRVEYESYIKVYAKIQYAQSLENEYANIRTLSNNETDSSFKIYKTTIEDARKREAQEIFNMISVLERT